LEVSQPFHTRYNAPRSFPDELVVATGPIARGRVKFQKYERDIDIEFVDLVKTMREDGGGEGGYRVESGAGKGVEGVERRDGL